MSVDYTSMQLIADIKRIAIAPNAQTRLNNTDFCNFINDCQTKRLIPSVLKVREEFFVTKKDYALGDGLRTFDIPERAVGQRVRQIQVIDADGKILQNIQRLSPEIGEQFSTTGLYDDKLLGYIFEDNKIITSQDFSSTGPTLRIRYFRRPSRVVPTTNCAKVVGVALNGIVTIETTTAAFSTGDRVDFINGKPHFNSKGDDKVVVTASSSLIEFDPADLGDLAPGDWIAFAGETPIPQFPVELHSILIQYAVARVLDALGDDSGYQRAITDLTALEDNLFEMLDDRDDGSPQKIIAPNNLWNRTPYRYWRW